MIQKFAQQIHLIDSYLQLANQTKHPLEICESQQSEKLKEAFIQALWNEKSHHRHFQLFDETKVRIDYSGSWNDEAGPDFLNATVTFIAKDGTELQRKGDIEIHIRPADWFAHNHDKNDNFNNVILHVVWEESLIYPEHLPTLCLKNQLDSETIKQIKAYDWMHYPDALKFPPCPLAPYLALKTNEQLQHFFCAAAIIRFEEKMTYFQEQIISIGKQQTLYQGIAEALGYKNNREQFKQLANLAPFSKLKERTSTLQHEAMLFGSANLLPDFTSENTLPELDDHLKKLWNIWWKLRPDNLTSINWTRKGRPLNSPERRIAALAALTSPPKSVVTKIIKSIQLIQSHPEPIKYWDELLTPQYSFWEEITNFNNRTRQPSSLLGKARRNEIIANIILPFAAAISTDKQKFCELFLEMPTLQQNHLIKEAVNRFLIPPARAREIIKNNGVQQGMLKLIKENSDISEISPKHPLVKLLMEN